MAGELTEIARLAVKLTPDTRKFYEDAKEDLITIEQRLPVLTVEAVLSRKSLERIESDLNDIADEKVRIKIDANSKVIDDVQEDLRDLSDEKVKIKIDAKDGVISQIRKDLKSIADEDVKVKIDSDAIRDMAKIPDQDVDVRLNLDRDAFRDLADIDKFTEDIDFKSAAESARDLQKILEDLSQGREIPLGMNIRDKHAQRVVDDLLDKLSDEEFVVKMGIDERQLKALRNYIANNLSDRPVSVPFDIDDKSRKDARKELEEAFGVFRDIEIPKRVLRDFAEDLDKVMGDTSPIKPTVDRRALGKAVNLVESEFSDIEAVIKDIAVDYLALKVAKGHMDAAVGDVDVDVKSQMDKSSAMVTQARLRSFFRPIPVRIESRFDRAGALRDMAGALGEIGRAVSGVGIADTLVQPLKDLTREIGTKTVPKLGALTLALGGLTGAAIGVGGLATSLANELSYLAALALPVPGILTGVAIGMGTMVIGLAAIKDYLPDVVDAYSALGDVVKDNFWAEAAAPLEKMAMTYLPAISEGLALVSRATGTFIGNLSSSLLKKLSVDEINIMFGRLADSIKITSDNTDAYAGIIKNLGMIGTTYLAPLSEWFNKLVSQFDAFLQRNIDNNNVFIWVDKGIDALNALWDIGVSIVSILGDIGYAAQEAGAYTLNDLAGAFQELAALTGSPAFHEAMTSVFGSTYDMLNNIVDGAGPGVMEFFRNFAMMAEETFPRIGQAIGDAFGLLFDVINNPASAEGFILFVAGISEGLSALRDSASEIAIVIGGLHIIMGAIAMESGPLMNALFESLALIVGPLSETIAGVFVVGMRNTTATIREMMPYLPPIVDAFNDMLLKLGPLSQEILPIFQAGLKNFLDVLPLIIEGISIFLTILTNIANVVGPVLVPAMEGLGWLVKTIFQGIIDGANMVLDGFGQFVTGFNKIFGINGEMQDILGGLKDMVLGVLEALLGAFLIWANVTLFNVVRSGLMGIVKLFDGSFRSIIRGFGTFFSTVSSNMAGFFMRLATSVGNGLRGVARLFARSLETIALGIANFLKGGLRGFSTFMSQVQTIIATGLGRWKTTLREGWTSIERIFSDSMKSIKDGITRKGGEILQWFRNFPNRIKESLGDLSRLLFSAGTSVMNGLTDGLKDGWRKTKNFLGNVTREIPEHKGPPSRDAKLLKPAGESIMRSLVDGFESEFGTVERFLGNLTDLIDGRDFGEATMGLSVRASSAALAQAANSGNTDNSRNLTYINHGTGGMSSEEELLRMLDRGRSF